MVIWGNLQNSYAHKPLRTKFLLPISSFDIVTALDVPHIQASYPRHY